MNPSIQSLLHPRRFLRELDEAAVVDVASAPWLLWVGLSLVAVGGSLWYGATLGLAVGWPRTSSALWLCVSAGLAWCFFGPALLWATGRNPLVIAHACLVTTTCGELILCCAALANLWLAQPNPSVNPGIFNAAAVGISDVCMAGVLAMQLEAIGVPIGKTLVYWVGVLNGAGAVIAWNTRWLLTR